MMRLLHIHSGNIFGGVERILIALAERRVAASHVEHCFALCFGGRLPRELSRLGAAVFLLPPLRLSRPWEVARTRASLKTLLRNEGFDLAIIHSAWSHLAFAGVLNSAELPELFWLHTEAKRRSILEHLAPLRLPSRIVSVSEYVDRSAQRLFPGIPSSAIYSPLALDAGAFAAADRGKTRARLGTGPDDVVILQASRLERWKGHLELIRALQLLRDDPRWRCWIAGGASSADEREYLEELQETARDLDGRVQFLGARNDVPELLTAADIYCQPNLEGEGFSIAFMEAFYAGLPIVTSAIGGAREIVDASSGFLFRPGDTAALAQSLQRLIAEPSLRREMGAEGRRLILKRCDPATQFRKLEEVFHLTARTNV